jgi:3-oxoadipate enol-lactonase
MNKLYFLKQGNWRAGQPVVVLSHALGCDLSLWDGVADELERYFAILRYDHRGHGHSPSAFEPFTIQDLAQDAHELIEREVVNEGMGAVIFVGLSMGGMTAQALAAMKPAWLQAVVIANSAQQYDDATRAAWTARIESVLNHGMASVADVLMQRWFSPAFLAAANADFRHRQQMLLACDPKSYANACAAVRDIDFAAGNATVTSPVLVIAGLQDTATPPAMSESIVQSMGHAFYEEVDAGHLSAVEQPQALAAVIANFIWQSTAQ